MRRGNPMRAKASGVEAAEAAQRSAMYARDGRKCAFERLRAGKWVRCNATERLMMCHVYKRSDCAKASEMVDVVITGCELCHDAFDRRVLGLAVEQARETVRVPAAAEDRAWQAIVANSKSPIPRRNLNGERM